MLICRTIPTFYLLILFLIVSCDTQPTQSNNNGDPDNGTDFSHTRNPGTSSTEFIRDDTFTELVVEIQYMPGYRPTDDALNELKTFLESHLVKSNVILMDPEEVPSGGQASYTANEIRELESMHRRHFTNGNTLASYNLFVDGEYSNANVLGIAYYNTSNAYFGRTIHNASGTPPLNPGREKIEGTVLRHEYGHLMGLVNSGTDMQEEHQSNGPHCNEEECIMYYSVNTTNFFANLFDGTIPDLDDFCVADIQAVQE